VDEIYFKPGAIYTISSFNTKDYFDPLRPNFPELGSRWVRKN